jgi:hypothetical protein
MTTSGLLESGFPAGMGAGSPVGAALRSDLKAPEGGASLCGMAKTGGGNGAAGASTAGG